MKNNLFNLIDLEKRRQASTVNLIASENYASSAVLAATGSVLTNKYAEGYPGRRYYGGCEIVDQVETYAIEAGKKLFKADHVNVQAHSGASANFAVYFSFLKLGDTVLGMSLTAGGHLTHGHHINFSGKFYNFIPYGVDQESERINYDQLEQLAQQHKPKMIVAGASAYARLMDYERLAKIAQSVNALLFVDMAHIAGLVAADIIPSPVPWADIVSSTTHKTLRGPRGGMIITKQALGATLDKSVMPGCQGGPLMHVIAAKAVAFDEARHPSFKTYANNVVTNAITMAKTFSDLGYRLVTGGTDTHLFLLDLRDTKNHGTLTGKDVEELLGKCGIIVNRNTVPFDTQSPLITSGIRMGTPALTTRGFGKKEVEQVAVWIDDIIRHRNDDNQLETITDNVKKLCEQFPIPTGTL